MRKFLALTFLISMTAFPTWGQDVAKDLDKLQGNWYVDLMIERGKKPPEEETKVLEVAIKKDVLSVKEKGKVVAEFQMKLDPSTTPKNLDLVHTTGKEKGQAETAIYAIEGDTFKICVNEESKARPKAFESKEKSDCSLIVLKRKP